jgi:23S rRNA pseudouridine2605 synthase
LTARHDEFARQTIYDLPMLKKVPFLVSPVGRLDYRTEGLLLLTNDGDLASRLTHPKYEVPRQYHVLITGKLTEAQEKQIVKGIDLEDGPTGKAIIRYAHGKNLGASRGSWYAITVYEGRNRLVRRMFEHLGAKVVRLIRVSYGEVRMPEELAPGEYRQLTAEEILSLKKSVNLK